MLHNSTPPLASERRHARQRLRAQTTLTTVHRSDDRPDSFTCREPCSAHIHTDTPRPVPPTAQRTHLWHTRDDRGTEPRSRPSERSRRTNGWEKDIKQFAPVDSRVRVTEPSEATDTAFRPAAARWARRRSRYRRPSDRTRRLRSRWRGCAAARPRRSLRPARTVRVSRSECGRRRDRGHRSLLAPLVRRRNGTRRSRVT